MYKEEFDSTVSCTLQSLTPQCHAHCRVWLPSAMHTAESDSPVPCTLQSQTPQCHAHSRVWLHSEMHTAESDSFLEYNLFTLFKLRLQGGRGCPPNWRLLGGEEAQRIFPERRRGYTNQRRQRPGQQGHGHGAQRCWQISTWIAKWIAYRGSGVNWLTIQCSWNKCYCCC